jgi:hypothetical protein
MVDDRLNNHSELIGIVFAVDRQDPVIDITTKPNEGVYSDIGTAETKKTKNAKRNNRLF